MTDTLKLSPCRECSWLPVLFTYKFETHTEREYACLNCILERVERKIPSPERQAVLDWNAKQEADTTKTPEIKMTAAVTPTFCIIAKAQEGR